MGDDDDDGESEYLDLDRIRRPPYDVSLVLNEIRHWVAANMEKM